MIESWARKASAKLVADVALALGKLGLHANTVTLLGCAVQVGVGVLLAHGFQTLGGGLLAFGAGCDAIDGALARQMGGATKFGAFLDSVLDRVSESALLAGLGWWYMHQQDYLTAFLAYLAIVGSVLVSYARARAEAVGIECKVGFFTRMERMLLLIIVLIFGWTTIGLWILAVGTLLTATHRIIHVYVQSRSQSEALVLEEQPAAVRGPS